MDKLYFFTQVQGNFLIRLLLAHIVADFILQTKMMVENKKWFSKSMLIHISIVCASTYVFTQSWKITLIVSISHWVIDSLKESYKSKWHEHSLFVIDQLLHGIIILGLWILKFSLLKISWMALHVLFTNYKFTLLLLAYSLVIWPLGYLIRFALQKMVPQKNEEAIEHGGKLIGQFERIIILTFVLLGQYEAIGFLITGKSIIRFADKSPEVKSEYVLVGTMMSYALSILIGITVNYLFGLG
jgi:hypothetical protein